MGDREGARAALERALEVEPAHGPARFNLALLLDEAGRRDEAVAELERLRREAPASASGRAAADRLAAWGAGASASAGERARIPSP
jgi:tetratricopeptide (TPR) repeat protein